MNAFKRYVRNKGIKLNIEYPWLPFEKTGYSIEDVYVSSEYAYVTTYTNAGSCVAYFHRDGTMTNEF